MSDAVRASALWAAYGDALGFITEGVNAHGLKRRLGGGHIGARPWRRKIGYRGPEVALPAGCYSDDTQLRLATSRAIGANGSFDVEVFAGVELPLWPLYALGAGRGSLDSARRIASGTAWRELVLCDRAGRYVNGGGNGGAMRIQPLIWAGMRGPSLMRAVVENVACTHGHPKAFVGALFHAACVASAIDDQGQLSPHIVPAATEFASNGLEEALALLGDSWVDQWNRASGAKFHNEWAVGVREIGELTSALKSPAEPRGYADLLKKSGLLGDEQRGSATKTSAAAFVALALLHDQPPQRIIEVIVKTFGSDTDSIATMAGAILGAALLPPLPEDIQDQQYITQEADRVAIGATPTHSDGPSEGSLVLLDGERIQLGALGEGTAVGPRFERPNESYRWYRMKFGQTLLLHETDPRIRESGGNAPSLLPDGEPAGIDTRSQRGPRTVATAGTVARRQPEDEDGSDIAAYARRLATRGMDPTQIGRVILSLVRRDGGEGLAAVFAYEVVRAVRARAHVAPPDADPQPTASPRAKPGPLIQLQMTANLADGETRITGIVANYGRGPATDVLVLLQGRKEPLLRFEGLAVQERHDIDMALTGVAIVPHEAAVAVFQNGAERMRQEGRFETAPGRPDVLILKGLGPAAIDASR